MFPGSSVLEKCTSKLNQTLERESMRPVKPMKPGVINKSQLYMYITMTTSIKYDLQANRHRFRSEQLLSFTYHVMDEKDV